MEEAISLKPDIYGVAKIRFVVPPNVTDFTLTAFYADQLNSANVSINAVAYQSRNGKYLQVETSTENAIINRFAIISVQSNFHMHSFFYLVSGNVLVSVGFRQ